MREKSASTCQKMYYQRFNWFKSVQETGAVNLDQPSRSGVKRALGKDQNDILVINKYNNTEGCMPNMAEQQENVKQCKILKSHKQRKEELTTAKVKVEMSSRSIEREIGVINDESRGSIEKGDQNEQGQKSDINEGEELVIKKVEKNKDRQDTKTEEQYGVEQLGTITQPGKKDALELLRSLVRGVKKKENQVNKNPETLERAEKNVEENVEETNKHTHDAIFFENSEREKGVSLHKGVVGVTGDNKINESTHGKVNNSAAVGNLEKISEIERIGYGDYGLGTNTESYLNNDEILYLDRVETVSIKKNANARRKRKEKKNNTTKNKPKNTENKGKTMGQIDKKGQDRPRPHNKNGPETSKRPLELCKYVLSGSCSKGKLCPFSHDLSATPCVHYAKGFCSSGANCKFKH